MMAVVYDNKAGQVTVSNERNLGSAQIVPREKDGGFGLYVFEGNTVGVALVFESGVEMLRFLGDLYSVGIHQYYEANPQPALEES